MRLPAPRGPLSSALAEHLFAPPHSVRVWPEVGGRTSDAVVDEDLQLALFICYELYYGGFAGVDARWEWQPSLLALRAALEDTFEQTLIGLVGTDQTPPVEVPARLFEMTAAEYGPSLSRFMQRDATLGQFREFVAHRSIYHLREADPHTWAIPRITGRAKAALVEIQADEYGGGRPGRMHSELFAMTMSWLGLGASYGAYVDVIPAVTLAINNVMSLFGLHRRHRGAVLGHLAALEMTSSLPNRRYAAGLRRLGGTSDAAAFYDEHVEADAVHEQIAAHDLCGSFCAAHPDEAGEVLFGAACCLALERLFAGHLLGSWGRDTSALRAGWTAMPDGLPDGVDVARQGAGGARRRADGFVGAVAERFETGTAAPA
jgi:hypothetical protein